MKTTVQIKLPKTVRKKAYIIYDATCPEEGSTIVFGWTGKDARKNARKTDAWKTSRYFDLRAVRSEHFDRLYKGQPEADWNDPETRLALVRDFGWTCASEEDVLNTSNNMEDLIDAHWRDCSKCVARNYCCGSIGEEKSYK